MSSSSSSSRPKRMVGVSLKLYFTLSQTSSYIQSLIPLATNPSVELFIIPDFLSLSSAAALLSEAGSGIRLGAQDCFWEDEGAFTGEVSPKSLASLGVSIVCLGHAERRRLFSETNPTVALKARAVLRNAMTPLICIGETTLSTPSAAVEEITPQITAILDVMEEGKEVVFAYEPVWAIGASEPAEPGYVVEVVRGLRRLCEGREGRFLYGGSAGPGTWEGLRAEGGVDGLFLGRFAHDVKNLERVVEEVGSV